MDKFELIKIMVREVEAYNAVVGNNLSLEGYHAFLGEKLVQKTLEVDLLKSNRTINSEIARLLTSLNRYAKFYFKVVLEGEETQNLDEVVFLIILMGMGQLSKTELITHALSEKTTGMEILKRMENHELIRSFLNPSDGRSKLIEISPKGLALMSKLFPKMDKVSNIITGNLTEKENELLYNLLKKLDDFHKPIFINNSQKQWLGYGSEAK
jgi:DNA-binding MarR family transcriptional regulator